MTSTSLLLQLVTGLAVVALATSAPPEHDRHYSAMNRYVKRPQELLPLEPFKASPQITFPEESESQPTVPESPAKSAEPTKVIIKLASAVAPLSSPSNSNDRKDSVSEDKSNGCNCEKIDSCPIEMMDFTFSVSCSYGTVRCCRPVEPATTTTTPTPAAPAAPVAPAVKRPGTMKKPVMCKCKSRKECDLFFRVEESEQIDRKDECPAGSVKCCETGNMGNPKEGLTSQHNKETHQVLGNSEFRPIQLPFLKMPNTERVSEIDSVPRPQITQLPEEPTQVLLPVNKSTPVETQPAQVQQPAERPVQQQQTVQQQASRPPAGQPQIPQKQFSAPVRPVLTTSHQQHPVNNPTSFNNAPVRHQASQMGFPAQQHQQQFVPSVPVQHQQQLLSQPIRPGPPPFRQQGQPLQQQKIPMMMQPPQATNNQQSVPAGVRPSFGLQAPPNFNAQQFPSPPAQQPQPPRPLMNQNFFQQIPPAPPVQHQQPPQQPSSSGGFFSSLMSMFTK